MSEILYGKKELSEATHTPVAKDVEVCGISIDSRKIEKGDLFVALKGENFNGHAYVAQSFEQGAVAALVSEKLENVDAKSCLIQVEDTLEGLVDVATYRRAQMKGRVIGVTGSVGKTSTKGMMAHALSAIGKTHATLGNLNNHIGLPLTLARMPKDTEYAVIEMGMNHTGEIAPLTALTRPHVAMVTTVASVHLEYFESEQAIAREKAQIFKSLEEGGVAVLNRDNQHFDFMRQLVEGFNVAKVVTFGKHASADAKLVSYSENVENQAVVEAIIHGKKIAFILGITGEHQAINALGVLASIDAAGADVHKAAKALKTYSGADGRGKVQSVEIDGKIIDVMDDSYNASPASIAAGVKNLASYAKRKNVNRAIAVLGDMFELGDTAAKLHADLAHNILENKVDLVFTAGDLMRNLYDRLPNEQRGGHYENADETAKALKQFLQDGDVLLVKGSRGMRMDKVVAALR